MENQIIELEKRALTFYEKAKIIQIKDNETFLSANDFLLAIKKMQKEIDATFDPIIQKTHQAHKEALEQKEKHRTPLIQAEKIIKTQIISYNAELEKIQREATERIRREQEEIERKRKEEEEKLLKEATKLELEGKKEEAEKLIKTEISVPETKETIPEKPRLQGTAIRKVLKWRIKDFNSIPREYLIVDSVKISNTVRMFKEQTNIPGIELYHEDQVASGREKTEEVVNKNNTFPRF